MALGETLYIKRIDAADAPVLDGDAPDPAWRSAKPVTVLTGFGGNLGGKGNSAVEIRAVHDGKWVYFRFTWEDPTRSLKHLPLVKREDGWHVLHDRYDRADERAFFEDKFAVLITNEPIVIPGDHTYRGGPTPVADRPSTLSQRGLHLASVSGQAMEVWQWKASSGGLLGWIDRHHFDLPVDPTRAQAAGEFPYRGGYIQDARAMSLYADNCEAQPLGGYERPVQPRRLPRDWNATHAALGKVDLEPDQGDTEGSRWWMTMPESEPYSADLDVRIPVGTVIPGSLILADDLAQRALVRGAARWGVGKWTLEVARRLDAAYPDVPIGSNTRMWVAVFDHAQTYHTRHIRPVRLELQR
ncbi:ethylbenzene dehydrogenase-related protein [Bradyrhizobium sp. CB3481]|uniref:ethylbenzene dehydrogenase-related protein n=1 Tax=Bradyrhizobium sp. CB3481 TaxID=3039158 RepID=UPI0024B088BB|nr:ethylbenzene dehydrogenase-related protein [Bradyrhizobium sp. CB3481]WFU18585.1 ethylbenzene dehydrogenase-related protein [Bradyrhizobium sp. CB3481]